MFPPENASICDITIITERFTKLLTSLVLWPQDLHIISKSWKQHSITQVREVRRIMCTWANSLRWSDLPKRTRKPQQVEQNPSLCPTGLIHSLVTTSLPILSAKNFSSVVCQYSLPEESLKDRVLKFAATAYFISVKTNFSKKKKKSLFCFLHGKILMGKSFSRPTRSQSILKVQSGSGNLWCVK